MFFYPESPRTNTMKTLGFCALFCCLEPVRDGARMLWSGSRKSVLSFGLRMVGHGFKLVARQAHLAQCPRSDIRNTKCKCRYKYKYTHLAA